MRFRPRLKYRVILLGVSVIFVIVLSQSMNSLPATGTTSSLQQQVLSIASDLRAPDDHDTMTVANSSLPTAQTMRYEIQQYLLQGKSKSDIVHIFEMKYGSEVLAAPLFSGFGSVVWVIPAVILLLCVVLLLFFSRTAVLRKSSSIFPRDDRNEVNSMVSSIEETLQDYL